MKDRTLKQKWSSERLWMAAGSLAGLSTRTEQVAKLDSITPREKDVLLKASGLIRSINVRHNKDLSWRFFRKRRQ